MCSDQLATTQQLAAINWEDIRLEYFKVWADFEVISKPFGITFSEHQINALGHMLVSMDLIDSAIDREAQKQTRQAFCESILAWMKEEEGWYPPHEMIDTNRLLELRNIIARRKIATPFLASASRVFRASERKRNSTTVADFITNLVDEGQSAAEMTISIIGRNTNARFSKFLQRVMRIGTLVDALLDADDDFEKGILKLVPNRLLRFKLKAAIARQLPGLILVFPDRSLLWRYCLSYTRAELTPLDVEHDHPYRGASL